MAFTLIAILADVSLAGSALVLGWSELAWLGLAYWVLALVCWSIGGFSKAQQWGALFSALCIAQVALIAVAVGGELTQLESDSWYYDGVAREIAARVGLWEQINPFAWGYVWEAGIDLGGEIAMPGFYKLLGILYTFLAATGKDPLVFAVSLINTFAFSLTGYVLARLLMDERGERGWRRVVRGGLWWTFMLNPYLLEQVTLLRKDLLTLAIFALGVEALASGRGKRLVACASAIAALRWVQAAVLGFGALFGWCQRSTVLAALARNPWVRGMVLVGGVLVVTLIPFEREMAFETAQAYSRDLSGASFGLSQHLQNSLWGSVAYAWAYPFPSLHAIKEAGDFVRSAFSILWGAVTGIVLLAVLAGSSWAHNTHKAEFMTAIELMYLAWFLGLVAVSIVSLRSFGFVIMEARYKLPLYFLAVVWISVRCNPTYSVRGLFARRRL